jgi:hypothetical protein
MDAAAPAEAAPMPSTAAAKGSMYEYLADSVHFDAKVVAEAQVEDAGYDLKTEEDAEDVALYGGAGDAGASTKPVENTTPFHEPPTAEEPVQYDPPDHATIHAALELVVNELMSVDGMDAPLEEDYFYCVLSRTDDGKQKEETRLEYFGLSDNGKYYMFSLRMYTVTAPDSPAQGAEYITDFNNFAVPREMNEVLREFDENRSPEHQKAYLKALVD